MHLLDLASTCEFVLDGTHSSPQRTNQGIPVLSAQNVNNGKLFWQTDRFTTEQEYQVFRKRLEVSNGDLLLTIVGSIGRAAVFEGTQPVVFQRSVAVLRPKKTLLCSRYLYHITQSDSFQNQLQRATNQSSQAGVYLGKLKQIVIPLPPLSEQRRIAAILDQADALRAKRREVLSKLDALATSIFQNLITDSLQNKWSCGKLTDIADIQFGYPFKSELYACSAGSLRLCRGANILPGRIDWSNTVWWPKSAVNGLASYSLNCNDVLVAMDRPWISEGFKVAQIREHDLPALVVQRVARLRARDGMSPHFLFYLLRHSSFTRHCKPTETTVPHISPKDIRSYECVIPPTELQNKFEAQISQIQLLRRAQETSLAKLDALFASLQHRAFRGEL